MARICLSFTFPGELHLAIQRHSNSSLVTFPVNTLFSLNIYRYRRTERSVTGGVRAFESSSAKPMNWCDGVQEPRVLIAPGNATQYLFANEMLQELQWFKNLYGSCFFGDYITEMIDVVSILGEYFKEKPWLELLLNAEGSNTGLCNELQEQQQDKKGTTAKKGRQAKKVKLETESHNIREMFTRASLKKS
ncbi:hypothetical protein PHAVU_009G102700 [Phaseolus vulgaris]|uniref:Uncharacterized protein n=1 Tax=Phaseolus vulgaris TaxID=3885 RepID=V7AV16_PHAVU|nr:hypothetical protein PHAVU_009G102700g [Phaseolus vulgaris]ESW09130.1 hypothetical protein PHAVU_009G102700g [Phaseolus vulgaris]